MKISDFGRYVLGICASVVMLAGCRGGSQSQLMPSGPSQQSSWQSRFGQLSTGQLNTSDAASGIDAAALQMSHNPSWMLPEAKSEELLYIANSYSSIVRVYSYPEGKLVGSVTKVVYAPDGVCVDKKNNVWIVDNYQNPSYRDNGNVLEFTPSVDRAPPLEFRRNALSA